MTVPRDNRHALLARGEWKLADDADFYGRRIFVGSDYGWGDLIVLRGCVVGGFDQIPTEMYSESRIIGAEIGLNLGDRNYPAFTVRDKKFEGQFSGVLGGPILAISLD